MIYDFHHVFQKIRSKIFEIMNVPHEFWVSVFDLLSVYDLNDRAYFGMVCRLFLSIWISFKEKHITTPLRMTAHLPRVFIHGYQTDYPDLIHVEQNMTLPLALLNDKCAGCNNYVFHIGTNSFGISSSSSNANIPLLVQDSIIELCNRCVGKSGYSEGWFLVAEKLSITMEELEEQRHCIQEEDAFFEYDNNGVDEIGMAVKSYAKLCGVKLLAIT